MTSPVIDPTRELLTTLLNGADLERGSRGGWLSHRMPRWVRDQVSDELFVWASAQSSGTVLRFRTEASKIVFRVSCTTGQVVGFPTPTPSLVIRWEGAETEVPLDTSLSWMDPSTGDIRRGAEKPFQDVIVHPPSGEPVSVLLPHNAMIEFLAIQSDAPLLPVEDDRLDWIHYGSSISHCFDARSPASTWPFQAADALGWNLHNLGLSGQAHLDPAVGRLISGRPADVITVKVGINLVESGSMSVRTFRPALHGFLDRIREGHPDTPVIVISAIACPILEHTTGPTSIRDARFIAPAPSVHPGALTLEISRQVAREVVAARTDPFLSFIDGTALFGSVDASHLFDNLHPNQRGMDLIAQRFVERVSALLPIPRTGVAERDPIQPPHSTSAS